MAKKFDITFFETQCILNTGEPQRETAMKDNLKINLEEWGQIISV